MSDFLFLFFLTVLIMFIYISALKKEHGGFVITVSELLNRVSKIQLKEQKGLLWPGLIF